MDDFTSPLSLTDEQRKANMAALQNRIANVMDRVANDKTKSAQVRKANARDAATARKQAAKLS